MSTPAYNFRKVHCLITNRCNFSCGMCTIIHGKKSALTEAHVRSLIEEADRLGFDEFEISGGEPYYLPYFRKVLEDYAGRTRVKIKVCTNAFHLDDDLIASLAGRSGIHFQVSFDGTKQIHNQIRVQGRYDAFTKSDRAFRSLAAAGIPVSLNTVIQRHNVGDILPIYRHFKDVPYLFHGFGIVEDGSWDFANNDFQAEQIEPLALELEAVIAEAHADGKPVSLDHEMVSHIRGRGKPAAQQFPLHAGYGCTVPWSIVVVDEWGNVYPCFHTYWGKPRFNIRDGKLGDILMSPEYIGRSASRVKITGCEGCTTACYFHDTEFRRKCMDPTEEDIRQRDRQRRFLSGPIGKAASQLTELSWKSADYIRFKTSGRA